MASKNINWKFPGYKGGKTQGFKISGIEAFKEHILLSFTKEICQNSLDAVHNKKKPVVIELKNFQINKSEFPDRDKFVNILDNLITHNSKKKYDKSAEEYYKNSKKIINQDKIDCIRISDFNTTGLLGNEDGGIEGTDWYSLVKSEGDSDKPVTAGGSYGMGKFASFACSRLRTVFYSTADTKGAKAYQGVSRLSSWKNEQGETTEGTGFYGYEDSLSNIPKELEIDPNFSRGDSGTDIYVLGFDNRDHDWKDQIFASVIDNFMIAIINEKLIFRLDGGELNKNTLDDYINKYKSEVFYGLLNENTLDYYYILKNPEKVTEFKYKFKKGGEAILKLAVKDDLKNRVAIVRSNGMKIFDKDRFPNLARFSGILSLEGVEINAFFRKLENPQHDAWEPDRLVEGKKEAIKERNKLYQFMKDSVRELVGNTKPTNMDAVGVGEYLPDDPDDDEEVRMEDTIEGDIIETPIKEPKVDRGIELSEKVGGRHGKNGGDGSGGGGGDPDPDGRGTRVVRFPTKDLRVFSDNSEWNYVNLSIDEARPELMLFLEISGEGESEKAEILEAMREFKQDSKEEKLEVKKNKIIIKRLDSNEPINIKFKLKEKGKWTMEAKLYENIN